MSLVRLFFLQLLLQPFLQLFFPLLCISVDTYAYLLRMCVRVCVCVLRVCVGVGVCDLVLDESMHARLKRPPTAENNLFLCSI